MWSGSLPTKLGRGSRESESVVRRLCAVLALVVLTAGCDDPFQVIEDVEFAASLDIDLSQMERLSNGVYVQDLVDGTGDTLVVGLTANVDYAGWLTDGTQFGTGNFSFTSGAGEVVSGFDAGALGMLVGGKRRLIIPPEEGYGDRQSGPIPPGSVLIFEIDLLDLS
jgi:peptidylprolyl isomerase